MRPRDVQPEAKPHQGFWRVLRACLLALPLACGAAHASSDLAEFVAAPDESYAWQEISSGRIGSVQYVELRMVSQTWRDIPWKHQLIVLLPREVDLTSKQAFLYVHGSRWRPEYESGQPIALPREAHLFARLARKLRAPLAVLRQVPFQPMFERREDALIAYTFDQYLRTGEADWPLLLPMVKSVVRGMDAVQEFAQTRWQLPIERFTVSGASKRGWTAWLTAAVDPRVAAVAPVVIDMLNIPAQIELQRATFGELSHQVQDYAEIDLPDRIDSPAGRALLEIVDPYSYRKQLIQPKLILLGTNDPYWPLDALNVYWDALPGPKHTLYIPNQGHGLRDVDRLVNGLAALHLHSVRGESLPEVSWEFTPQADRLELAVVTDKSVRRVTAWKARSSTRSFHEARWRAHRCRRVEDGYKCTQALRPNEYTALYAELSFEDGDNATFTLSTGVCIADGSAAAIDC